MGQANFEKNKKLNLDKSLFLKNDIPSTFAYRYLLQNISSLNNLKNNTKNDYSEFECKEFVHILNIEED